MDSHLYRSEQMPAVIQIAAEMVVTFQSSVTPACRLSAMSVEPADIVPVAKVVFYLLAQLLTKSQTIVGSFKFSKSNQ